MAGEIAIDRLVVEAVLRLGVHRVRARADQRQIALEHHVDELRQLIDRRLADEGADPSDARVAALH